VNYLAILKYLTILNILVAFELHCIRLCASATGHWSENQNFMVTFFFLILHYFPLLTYLILIMPYKFCSQGKIPK